MSILRHGWWLISSIAILAPGVVCATVTSSFSGGQLNVASDGADSITVGCTGSGGNVVVNGANPDTGPVACTAVAQLVVAGGPGDNTIDVSGASTFLYTALSGGTLTGGLGSDIILGSNGADVATGGDGNDTLLLGDGNDIAIWNPGDDNDVVEGQGGTDTLIFHGSNASETISIAPNGARALLSRDVAAVMQDLNDVEQIEYDALGGVDSLTVNALTGTDVTRVVFRLASTLGGGAGDGAVDTLRLVGSTANDSISADFAGGAITAVHGATTVSVTTVEPANDNLVIEGADGGDTLVVGVALASRVAALSVDGGAGVDTVNVLGTTVADTIMANAATPFVTVGGVSLIDTLTAVEKLTLLGQGGSDTLGATGAPTFDLTLIGGAGNDTLIGSGAADVLTGGADNDVLEGNAGSDTAVGGGGDDVFVWDPGDGNDVLEGQGGNDTLEFHGSGANEIIDIAPNGTRVQMNRNVGAISMDLNGIELIDLTLIGGADTVNTMGLPMTQQLLDGGAPGTVPGDTLNVAGFSGDALASPILIAGAAPIEHAGFEQTTTPMLIEAFLNGAQETPPLATPATGYGTVTLNGARDSIFVSLQFAALGGVNTLTNIHGPAARKAVAAPIISLPTSGTGSGNVAAGPIPLTQAQVAELRAGLWYFNVSSSAAAGGEIRGQIDNSLFRDGFD